MGLISDQLQHKHLQVPRGPSATGLMSSSCVKVKARTCGCLVGWKNVGNVAWSKVLRILFHSVVAIIWNAKWPPYTCPRPDLKFYVASPGSLGFQKQISPENQEISPEDQWLEDEKVPFEKVPFCGTC